MTGLPQFIRRMPFVFYALAIVLGAWRYYNDWTTAALGFQYVEDVGAMGPLAKSTALYWGVTDAVFVLGTGVMIHVLIAIYDKVGSQ